MLKTYYGTEILKIREAKSKFSILNVLAMRGYKSAPTGFHSLWLYGETYGWFD